MPEGYRLVSIKNFLWLWWMARPSWGLVHKIDKKGNTLFVTLKFEQLDSPMMVGLILLLNLITDILAAFVRYLCWAICKITHICSVSIFHFSLWNVSQSVRKKIGTSQWRKNFAKSYHSKVYITQRSMIQPTYFQTLSMAMRVFSQIIFKIWKQKLT